MKPTSNRGGAWTGCVLLAALAAAVGPAPRAAVAQPLLPQHVTAEANDSIERGLAYLARTQREDGSWGSRGSMGSYPTVMTSLAGLAFLAHGDTPFRGRYATSVKKAVDFICTKAEAPLKTNPDAKELLITAPGEETRSMYGHGFSMLFLAQVYGMCDVSIYQDRIRKVLEKAIVLTARSQSKAGGWLYTPDSNSDEGSVTVTQVQALRACRNAGIKVPKSTIDRAVKYIEICANPDGGISYSFASKGSSRPAISAAAVAVLYNAGQYESTYAAKGLKYVIANVKVTGSTQNIFGHYFYTHLYMSQAMYTAGGHDSKLWDDYYPKIRDELVKQQNKGDGSWMGDQVGTSYGTAIACLILQLPFNTLPIMQR